MYTKIFLVCDSCLYFNEDLADDGLLPTPGVVCPNCGKSKIRMMGRREFFQVIADKMTALVI